MKELIHAERARMIHVRKLLKLPPLPWYLGGVSRNLPHKLHHEGWVTRCSGVNPRRGARFRSEDSY